MHKKENSIQALALEFLNNKNNKTFKILIDRLKPGLISFVYKYVKDIDLSLEIVSKTFISVWEKLDQYKECYKFSTWVYAIAKNEALGQLRLQKRTISREKLIENHSKILKLYTPVVTMDLECIGPSGENLISYLHNKTLKEINNLSEPYKTVMVEREIKNKKLKEIANDLDWNLSTVKTRLAKARRDIAISIKEKYPELIEAYYES